MSQPACRSSFESRAEPEVRNDGSPQMHITSHGEEYSERYGGNDIHEPPPKEFLIGGPSRLQSESEITLDANLVTWDGPNDPSNPQNWSIKYKWWVTVVCTVMTINVYV